MKKFILQMILTVAVIFSSSNVALANQKLYGGSGGDGGHCIANTSDGGYIIAGSSMSNYIVSFKKHVYNYDVYIIKFNSSGTVVWQKMYYGLAPHSIRQTSDGGYIIAGEQCPLIDGQCVPAAFVLKLDSKGAVVWEKAYDGYRADSIQQTSDGGYIVAGYSYSTDHNGFDYYVVKLDGSGNVVWQNLYGGSGRDYASSIQQTRDGGYIVAGSSYSTDISGVTNHGRWDYYVIKLDGNGAIEWQEMYGGSGNDGVSRDYERYFGDEDDGQFSSSASSIQQTGDGGYILAGTSYSTDISGVTNHGDADVQVIKLDGNGAVEWQKMYGGSNNDSTSSIRQTSDGGYIVAGFSNSTDISGVTNHGGFEAYVLKLNSSGNVTWQKMFGGSKTKSYLHYKYTISGVRIPDGYRSDSSFDFAYDVAQISNGGYVVVGTSSSADISGATLHGSEINSTDVYVIKLDKNGAL